MDWSLLISNLQARGLSLSQIAKACDAGQATISELKGIPDRDPRFKLGQALIKLSKASDREIARIRDADTAKA